MNTFVSSFEAPILSHKIGACQGLFARCLHLCCIFALFVVFANPTLDMVIVLHYN
jgi:hypothetical protein